MTPQDYERYFHLSASLKHLEAARLPHLASDVRAELDLLAVKAESARREGHRRSFAPTLSGEDVEEMAAFGVRFGAIHWVPAVMNLREYDLPLVRSFVCAAYAPLIFGLCSAVLLLERRSMSSPGRPGRGHCEAIAGWA
jgi:hypothetical protein